MFLSILRYSWWAHDFPFDHNGTYSWKISRKLLSWTTSLIQITVQLHNHLCRHIERGNREVGQVSGASGRRSSLRQHRSGLSPAWELRASCLLCAAAPASEKWVQRCGVPGVAGFSSPCQALCVRAVGPAVSSRVPDEGLRVSRWRQLLVVLLHRVHAGGGELEVWNSAAVQANHNRLENLGVSFLVGYLLLSAFDPKQKYLQSPSSVIFIFLASIPAGVMQPLAKQ